MNFKNLSLLFVLIALSISCSSDTKKSKSSEVPDKPNVVFVLVDDLGVNDLSYTGSTYYETPNIDLLASNGTVFTQGYACSRVCSPSRASIFTGKFTARHGITDWIGEAVGEDWRKLNRHDKLLPADYVHNLPQEDVTLAEALKINGYKTFFAGKWHLGDKGSFPEDHGFDINVGGWDKGGPKGGYFSPFKNPYLQDNVDGENLSMRLANETAIFIEENKEAPFFAFLSFYAVHGPIQTDEEKWKKYREKAVSMGLSDNGFEMEKKLPIRHTQDNPIYGGLVESMDDAVGVVLNKLKELNLDKNTIVVFTSDNGGVSSGDSFSTSNLPLRGGKGYQWEGGIREPYIIYVPWIDNQVKEFDYPVTGADFFPTILDYANVDLLPNQHKDGVSLKPMIDRNEHLEQRPLYWHYPHYGNQGGDPASIIREGDWKLIHYYEEGENALYNLKSDPYEKNNLAEQYPDLEGELGSKLIAWLDEVGAVYPEPDKEYSIEARNNRDTQIENNLLPRLEKERKEMLAEDFQPNADWWGSKITKD